MLSDVDEALSAVLGVAPSRRQSELVGAPVHGTAAPFKETAVVEAINDGHNRGAIDTEPVAELLLRHRSLVSQQGQCGLLLDVDAELVKALALKVEGAEVELAEQETEAAKQRRGKLRSHAQSITTLQINQSADYQQCCYTLVMKVVQATQFGGPEVLVIGEMLDTVAGAGEVVVDVAVADTLHLDTVIRRGAFPFPIVEPPYVPGGGVAGEVASVGPGVDREWVGRRVAARTGVGQTDAAVQTVAQYAQRDTHSGGYAQLAVVAERALVPVPDGVGLREAAALINDGMTAMLLTESAQVRAGEWVLVTPAGGGLGSLLVQLLHATGAKVLGAARGEHKLMLARDLGADAAVDYSQHDWPEQVREATTGSRGLDVVLDGVGGQIGRASFDLTGHGGRFVGYGAPSGEFTEISAQEADQHRVKVVSLFELEMAAADEKRLPGQALAAAAAGRITPIIGRTLPLEQAADAHAAIEAREVIGKTLLLT